MCLVITCLKFGSLLI
jgi:hypothetical protein